MVAVPVWEDGWVKLRPVLKALEDVPLSAVLLCPPVLTPLLVLDGCADDCSDAVVARVLKVVVVRAWECVCDDAVVS